MGKPKAPKPADPAATAAAQTGTNIATAIAQQNLNNINQITPYGNLTYERTGTYEYVDPIKKRTYNIPTYTARQTLDHAQQNILDENNRAGLNLSRLAAEQSQRLGDLLRQPFDINTQNLPSAGNVNDIQDIQFKTLGERPMLETDLNLNRVGQLNRNIASGGDIRQTYGTDFRDQRQRVEDALLSRLNVQMDKDLENLESRLASRGIRLGSQAYRDAKDNFARHKNDARLGAIIAAGQEQNRLSDLEARRASFENAAQNQRFKQNLEGTNIANNVQAQAFAQERARAEFENHARQMGYQNHARQIDSENQQAIADRNARLEKFNASNALRNQSLNEQFAIRNQPINEISTLLSGTQIRNPNFVNSRIATINPVNFVQAQQNYDQLMNQQYQQQARLRSKGLENLFGMFAGL